MKNSNRSFKVAHVLMDALLVGLLPGSVFTAMPVSAKAVVPGPDVDAMSHSNEERQLLLPFESIARNYEVLQLLEPQKVSESDEIK